MSKQPDINDLLNDLNQLEDDTSKSVKKDQAASVDDSEKSALDFLDEISKERPSRPHTPRLKPGEKSGKSTPRLRQSIEVVRREQEKPISSPVPSITECDSKDAKVVESHAIPATPVEVITESSLKDSVSDRLNIEPKESKGGSWGSWGGSLWSTATSLRAEAEKKVRELQQSEEARRLQSNLSSRLKDLDLSRLASEASSTFSQVLNVVAPPISAQEILVVNVDHDLSGFEVERAVHTPFDRVMSQVEGGSLRVIAKDRKGELDFQICGTYEEAAKLAKASHEAFVKHPKAPETQVQHSNIFLFIQAYTPYPTLSKTSSSPAPETANEVFVFLLLLIDSVNSIEFVQTSQSYPQSWLSLSRLELETNVQPKEWIKEWIEEGLALCSGVLAQRYVARRMALQSNSSKDENENENEQGEGKRKMSGKMPPAQEDARAGVI